MSSLFPCYYNTNRMNKDTNRQHSGLINTDMLLLLYVGVIFVLEVYEISPNYLHIERIDVGFHTGTSMNWKYI